MSHPKAKQNLRGVVALFVGVLALTAACDGPGLACTGPQDCQGNPCCLTQPLSRGNVTLGCTNAPDACGVSKDIDYYTSRLCHSDADCVAGGINTAETKCCLASVMSQRAHTCTGPSRCGISGEVEPPAQR